MTSVPSGIAGWPAAFSHIMTTAATTED